jgi:hypothetical protein
MATIQDIASAMAQMEGANVSGSLAQRNNNPGNLKYAGQTGAIGQDANGFAIFDSLASGQAALVNQLNLYADRGLTLSQALNIYAPPSENDTNNYVSFVSSQTGVDPNQPLASFRVG